MEDPRAALEGEVIQLWFFEDGPCGRGGVDGGARCIPRG